MDGRATKTTGHSRSWTLLLACGVLTAGCSIFNNGAGDGTNDAGPVLPNGCPVALTDGGPDAGLVPVDAGPMATFAGAITGTINQSSFTGADGILIPAEQLGFTNTEGGAIIIASYTGVCARLVAGDAAPGAGAFVIDLAVVDGNGNFQPSTPGTYTVISSSATPANSTLSALVNFNATDGSCNSTSTAAVSGTVTVTAYDLLCGGKVTGSFDVMFITGEEVTGSFTTPFCLGPATSAENCVPG